MKNLIVETPLRTITLKYKKEQPLSNYENDLVKKYSELNMKTGEADEGLQQLKKNFEELQGNLKPLKEQLEEIKKLKQGLPAADVLHGMDNIAQIKNIHQLTQKADIFNAQLQQVKPPTSECCHRCRHQCSTGNGSGTSCSRNLEGGGSGC